MIIRLLLALILTALPVTLVQAQEKTASAPQDRIVAKVNGDIITSGDMWTRYYMIQKSSKLPDNTSIRQDAFPQILYGLIDEKLQLQEAKRAGVAIADADIDAAFADLAKKNNVDLDKFTASLEKQGVNKDEIRRQLKAQLAWIGVVRRVVRPGVNVTDAEVQKIEQELNSYKGKKEFKLAEIRLPGSTAQEKKDSVKLAKNLTKEMQKGAPFREVAAKFSIADSAKQGGLRQSVLQGELPPAIDKLVSEMPKGALSVPVDAEGQIWIILKLDERTGEGAPDKEVLKEKVGSRKLERAADAYLRDLRDEALIEYP